MYILVELQTTDSQTASIVTAYTDRAAAEAAYHTILAAAVVSPVHYHTVMMVDERGNTIKKEFYRHIPEPEPEAE
jgi:hypothetical protein